MIIWRNITEDTDLNDSYIGKSILGFTIQVDASDVELTFPKASENQGAMIFVKKTGSGGLQLMILTASDGEYVLIDGVPSASTQTIGRTYLMVADRDTWRLVRSIG